jgi:hypothetical protein
MEPDYDRWLRDVRAALDSINMRMDDWQGVWRFEFEREYRAGTDPKTAAEKANRYWWHEQNRALGRDCLRSLNCWLPRDHKGNCQPVNI